MHGFTLAEVLITLGIIGVVAALTAPALVQNASNAKIGPTLAKVVSTVETANQKMMQDEEISNLNVVENASPTNNSFVYSYSNYMEKLSKYIAGSSYRTTKITKNDYIVAPTYYNSEPFVFYNLGGLPFYFSNSITLIFDDWLPESTGDYSANRGSFKGYFATMYVDVNGLQAKPNVIGKDIFVFWVDKSGTIIPEGGKTYGWLIGGNSSNTWKGSGTYACNSSQVGSGVNCAGSIFDNNLKVIYQ